MTKKNHHLLFFVLFLLIFTKLSARETYKIGDVILKNGKTISYSENITFSKEEKSNVIAIISGFKNNQAFGIGLIQAEKPLSWAKKNSNGFTLFDEIISFPLSNQNEQTKFSSLNANEVYFDEQDEEIDGSKNWNKICKIDKTDTKNPKENYPAFNFCINYSQNAHLQNTDFTQNWYLPNLYELIQIYKNKQIINSILRKLDKPPLQEKIYLTSSQHFYDNTGAFNLDFSTGYIDFNNKDLEFNICAIRNF